MRILYIAQYFVTPDEPGSDRHYTHAKYLVSKGHTVTVLSSMVNYKTGRIPEKYRGRIKVVEHIKGTRVIKLRSVPVRRPSFFGRMHAYLSFMLRSILTGLSLKERVDLVFATSPPIFVGLAGRLISWGKRAKFVLEVRDLWPESAVTLGFIKARPAIALANWLESFLYRRSSGIVAVTQRIQNKVLAQVSSKDRVALIPNGVSVELVPDLKRASSELAQWKGRFFAVYAGACGINNSIETIIDASTLLADTDIVFLIIGDGNHRPELEKRTKEYGIGNIHFLGAKTKTEVLGFLQLAGVCLLPMKPIPGDFKRGSLPNKLFDYLSSGTPLVAAVPFDGEAGSVIRRGGAGILVKMGDAHEMADAIRRVYNMSIDKRAQMGRNGRNYVIEHYTRERLATKLEAFLKSI